MTSRTPTKPEGCVDQNCALMPHAGMGVLGACKCLDEIHMSQGAARSRAKRIVLNALRWWQAQTRRAEDENAMLRRVLKDVRTALAGEWGATRRDALHDIDVVLADERQKKGEG